jgi:hypothetical protein
MNSSAFLVVITKKKRNVIGLVTTPLKIYAIWQSISECVKQMRTLSAISATDLGTVREWIEDVRRGGFGCERLDFLQQEVDAMCLQQEAEALHGDLRALQDMATSIHCMVAVRGPFFLTKV